MVAAYYFTLVPWLSNQSSLKLLDINIVTSNKEIIINNLNISPNPILSGNRIEINIPNGLKNVNYFYLTDVMGRHIILKPSQFKGSTVTLDIPLSVPAGIYSITIMSDNILASTQVLVY